MSSIQFRHQNTHSDERTRPVLLPGHVGYLPAEFFVRDVSDQPVVIVEVLSDSTRRLDDGEKKDAYFTIPSLTHYILLEHESPVAVVYQKADEHFERHEFTNLSDVIVIDGLGLSLPLQDLYEGVLSKTHPEY